ASVRSAARQSVHIGFIRTPRRQSIAPRRQLMRKVLLHRLNRNVARPRTALHTLAIYRRRRFASLRFPPSDNNRDLGGQMKRALALGTVAAALAVAAAHVAAGSNPNTLTLAVFGDSPYLDKAFSKLPHAEFDATPAFINTINSDPDVQAVIHVGDIHSGSEPCTIVYDTEIYNFWLGFKDPLIYTPGDNEWSDCTKANEEPGSDN